jgi:hypothetical protein
MTQGHGTAGASWPGQEGERGAGPGSWGVSGPAPAHTSWPGAAPVQGWWPWPAAQGAQPAAPEQPSPWSGDDRAPGQWDVVVPGNGWAGPSGTTPVPDVAPAPRTGLASPGSRRRLVVAGTAALALALALGGALGAGIGVVAADDQDRVDALSRDVVALQDQLADTEAAVSAAEDRAGAAEAAADAAGEEARAQVQVENADEAAALDAREADLAARESAVGQRESAVDVLEQQAADGSIPGDGVYLVGTEVAPGIYRASSPGEYCYWERLSGLSGEFDDLITNGLGAADATMTISGSDMAFSTDGCGSWQRIN